MTNNIAISGYALQTRTLAARRELFLSGIR
ncbi:MAG: hypothetical protein RLZZ226_1146 [Pseudomonadota bacterium]|jgi:hypothetical protein